MQLAKRAVCRSHSSTSIQLASLDAWLRHVDLASPDGPQALSLRGLCPLKHPRRLRLTLGGNPLILRGFPPRRRAFTWFMGDLILKSIQEAHSSPLSSDIRIKSPINHGFLRSFFIFIYFSSIYLVPPYILKNHSKKPPGYPCFMHDFIPPFHTHQNGCILWKKIANLLAKKT